MKKIVNVKDAVLKSKDLRKQNKKIVLVGGCFDVLHAGHISFLENSKKEGDKLFIFLESDENIKRKKGNDRPINSQKNRGIVLSALSSVDVIIPLGEMTKDKEYDKLIVQIKPDIIALTRGDKNIEKRQKQSNLVGAKLVLIDKVEGVSTTDFVNNIN